MARQTSLKGRLLKLKRRFKKVTPQRFFYNKKQELRMKYRAIKCWFLIHDQTKGYSIFLMAFRRKILFSIPEWVKLFKENVAGYDPIFHIVTTAVLPAINNKSDSAWKFVSLIGWTGDISKVDDTDTSTKSNPSKARHDSRQHKHRR